MILSRNCSGHNINISIFDDVGNYTFGSSSNSLTASSFTSKPPKSYFDSMDSVRAPKHGECQFL